MRPGLTGLAGATNEGVVAGVGVGVGVVGAVKRGVQGMHKLLGTWFFFFFLLFSLHQNP